MFFPCGRNCTLGQAKILLVQSWRKFELCTHGCFILFPIARGFQSHTLFSVIPLTCSVCPNIPCWQCLLYLQAFYITQTHKEAQGNWTVMSWGVAVFLYVKTAGFLLGEKHHPVFIIHHLEWIWKVSLQKLNVSTLTKIQLNTHYEPMVKPKSLSNYRQRMKECS